jgi:hypothetical protein
MGSLTIVRLSAHEVRKPNTEPQCPHDFVTCDFATTGGNLRSPRGHTQGDGDSEPLLKQVSCR